MTKLEIAKILVDSPAWDGVHTAEELCKTCSMREIQDAYSMLDEAEQEYFEEIYRT